jgi:structure-specific recognition protein 1
LLILFRDQLKELFGGKLQKEYDGPTAEIVQEIFRSITNVKVVTPGSFRSQNGYYGIKCSIKASEGHLYPLSDSLLFLPKPPLHMPFTDVSLVLFSRVGRSDTSRTFDMKVSFRKGGDVQIAGVDKEEHARLEQYLREKGVRVKSETDSGEVALTAVAAEPQALKDDEDESGMT